MASQHPRALLEIDNLTIRFGGVTALDGISFAIGEKEIVGLIGPNGAGKTTLFNCLSRLYQPSSGDIRWDGKSILPLPAHRIAPLGLGRTFQNLALFESRTVFENAFVGIHQSLNGGIWADLFRSKAVRAERDAARARVGETLERLNLSDISTMKVGDLTFATRKRVEFARALVSRPRLLMLDEPAGGLSHREVRDLETLIVEVRDSFGVAVLVVEHHLNLVMRVSDRVVAIDFGKLIAEGSPDEVRNHPSVLSAYLGEEAA